MQPWKVVVLLIFVSLAVVAVSYGIGGWYFSGEIYNGALQVHPPDEGPLDTTFDRGEADALLFRGNDGSANLFDDGRFGLAWDSGRSLVDGILSTETAAGISTVYRQRIAGEEVPAPGSAVRLDPFIWPGDPQTAHGIPFVEIEYQTEGGRAGAWYIEGTTNTWAIFIHGKGAPRNEALRLLPLAVERGYHAMVIDYRNDPGAPTDPSGVYQYGATEWQDVASAARHARSNGAQDLVMVGYSMGGANVASFLLESPLRSQTAAVILDSPVLNFGATIDHAAAPDDAAAHLDHRPRESDGRGEMDRRVALRYRLDGHRLRLAVARSPNTDAHLPGNRRRHGSDGPCTTTRRVPP